MINWYDGIAPEDLPMGDIRDIAESFGVCFALELCEKAGGVKFYIPKKVGEKLVGDLALLAEKVGRETVAILVAEFPGQHIQIIEKKNALIPVIRRYIIESAGHVSTKRLALETGTSERFVEKVIQDYYKQAAANAQRGLF